MREQRVHNGGGDNGVLAVLHHPVLFNLALHCLQTVIRQECMALYIFGIQRPDQSRTKCQEGLNRKIQRKQNEAVSD